MVRAWMVKGLRRMVLRLSDQRELAGVDIRVWYFEESERLRVWEKLEAALPLVERYSKRSLQRLHDHVDVVLAERSYGSSRGAWHRDHRLITLDYDWILDPSTAPFHIAATVVHEVTHAWLEAIGFQYLADRRARLEAVCFRAMAAYARRVPKGEEWSAYYEECAKWALSVGSDAWGDTAFRERAFKALGNLEKDLRAHGVPDLAIQMMRRLGGVGSA